MALKFPSLKMFSGVDAKSRIFLLFAGVVGISLLIYMLVRFLGGESSGTGPTKVAGAPSTVVSVPGSELSPAYAKLVEQENAKRSATALKEKTAAVPTLTNIVNSGGGGGENCTIFCPSDENANVVDDITTLVNQNILSQEEGNGLADLAANNVSIDEYAAALDALVKAGKLTPEQARLLLEKYKKQHANALLKDSAAVMDDMIQAGQLSLTAANELLELQKRNLTPTEYDAQLKRLVGEGKLTPEASAKLLAQYTQQKAREAAKVGVSALRQMAAGGQITPDVLKTLEELQSKNIPLDQYSAALDKLVAEGKMTPATAAKVLELYRAQRLGPTASAAQTAALERDKSIAAIRQMAAAGQITADTAKILESLQDQNLTPEQYAAALNQLQSEGKLNPDQSAKLLEQYKNLRAALDATGPIQRAALERDKAIAAIRQMTAGQITPETARALESLLGQNLTPEQYAAALNKLQAEGKLNPDQAAKLLEQYKNLRAVEAAGPPQRAALEREKVIAAIRQMAAGQITPETAKILESLQDQNLTPEQYAAALNKLQAQGKLNPDQVAKLVEQYKNLRTALDAAGPIGALLSKGGVPADFAKSLLNKQANNVSLSDYEKELKRGVAMKILTPDEAKRLYDQYQATLARVPAPTTGGVIPTVEGNIPFLELQKRIQEQQAASGAGAPVAQQQFENVPPPVDLQAQQAQQNQAFQERQQRIQQLLAAMSGQAQNLIGVAWLTPKMLHVQGSGGGSEKTTREGLVEETTTTTTTEKGGARKPVLIKAGTIIFGVLDTAVDSDYPDTPVMVTIIEGKYKNAKLLGKLSLAQNGDKVSLNFNLMDMDDWTSAKTVNAFAVDPDTARTVMASEVDNHYLERYGYTMATAFLQGYSGAITNAGTSTTGIFGTSTTHPELSPGNKFAVGLGQIGTTLSADAATKINRPATVKVNSGVGLGILFTAEVTE